MMMMMMMMMMISSDDSDDIMIKASLLTYKSNFIFLTIANNFNFTFFQEEAGKWTRRGVSLYLDNSYFLAERCTTVALYFRVDNPFFKAQSFLNRALSRFELGNISGTQSDAQEVKRLDKHFARVRELLFGKIPNDGFNGKNPITSQRSALRSH